jgi:hypothetical protein
LYRSPDEPAGNEPQGDKNTVQQRIDKLTKQRRDAERQLNDALAQNQELSDRLSNLEALVNTSPTRVPQADPASRQTPYQDPLAPTPQAPQANPNDLGHLVRDILQKELAPLTTMVQQSAKVNKQQRAFNAAANDFPDLTDPKSEAFQTFQQLWEGRPDLQELDDGPAIVAQLTRGILSDARISSRKTEEKKIAAEAITPSHATRLSVPDDYDKAVELKQKLADKGKTQGLQEDEMLDLIQLSLGTAKKKE